MPTRTADDDPVHPALRHLAGLSDDDARAVWARGRVVPVPEGWSMIHQHEAPANTYLLLEGSARVDLDRVRIGTLGPGDVVGEIAPLTHRLRTATVTALEPLVTLALTADDFAATTTEVPRFAEALSRIASARLAELDRSS